MKKRTNVHWANRTILQAPLYIGVCFNEIDFKKELKKLKVAEPHPAWIPEHKDAAVHFFETKKDHCCIVCYGKIKDTSKAEEIGLFVHEAVHIWQEVKEILDEVNPGKEIEAYCIQSITVSILETYFLKRVIKR